MTEDLGVLLITAAMVVVALGVSLSRLPRSVKLLVYGALALRVLGALGRHYMVVDMYGTGDSFRYFEYGVRYAERFWVFDFSPLWDNTQWYRPNRWYGTQFVAHATGFVHFFLGPTFFGGFLAFSLLAFVGLVGFGIAFHRAYPHVPVTNYLRWAWLFPALWFWPAAIGKEALLLMGLGLAVWGFVGRQGRVNWLMLAAGLALVFAVRVQVAAVLGLSMILAQWLSFQGRWTLGRAVQGMLILGVGLGGIYLAMQKMGIEGLDVEGVQAYMEENTGRGGGTRGSGFEGAQVGLAGIPMAVVNMLLRPFPWEARNVQVLLSAVEIGVFWAIVWYRRRQLAAALRSWHKDRLLRLTIPFVITYTITVGMLMANMGIIARQRIFLFPFLFLVVEAAPRLAARGSGGATGAHAGQRQSSGAQELALPSARG